MHLESIVFSPLRRSLSVSMATGFPGRATVYWWSFWYRRRFSAMLTGSESDRRSAS
jgi:hypothetical protein